MAFFDDRRFLLSHIRHSFITCDDTGMSEMVMLNETMPNHLPHDPDAPLLQSIEVELKSELIDVAQSYDIASDMEVMSAHRRRSNTAQRLELLKKKKKNNPKIKIEWKDNLHTFSENELKNLFPVKELTKEKTDLKKSKSLLSQLIKQNPSPPYNPFTEYAKFDGRVSEGTPTRRVLIFLTILSEEERSYPMEVVFLSNARVQDLIGLICWQYTNEGREPRLKPSVNYYYIRICEENGEVELDFPDLEPKDPATRFCFPAFALFERDSIEDLLVTVHINDGFSKIQVPDCNHTLQWIVDQTLKKRKADKTLKYRLFKKKDPNSQLDLKITLNEVDTREFVLTTDLESSSEEDDENDEEEISNLPDMHGIEAPLYKVFNVVAVLKLGRNTEVQLGISGKKVDITPLPSKPASKLWSSWQPKAASYNVESIADCELITHKGSTGKAIFKLTYHNGTEFQSQRFETDLKTAQEIVKKLQYIMQMRWSSLRDEYMVLKEQKISKKLSVS